MCQNQNGTSSRFQVKTQANHFLLNGVPGDFGRDFCLGSLAVAVAFAVLAKVLLSQFGMFLQLVVECKLALRGAEP